MPPPTSYLEANIDIYPAMGSDISKEEAVTLVDVKGSLQAFPELNNVVHNLILEGGEIFILENGIPLEI
jgi:hypothetical protein